MSVIQRHARPGTLAHIDDHDHGERAYIELADILPFHATASGIVTLAFLDESLPAKVLGRPLDSVTQNTETDPGILALHIEDVRRSGVGRSERAK